MVNEFKTKKEKQFRYYQKNSVGVRAEWLSTHPYAYRSGSRALHVDVCAARRGAFILISTKIMLTIAMRTEQYINAFQKGRNIKGSKKKKRIEYYEKTFDGSTTGGHRKRVVNFDGEMVKI